MIQGSTTLAVAVALLALAACSGGARQDGVDGETSAPPNLMESSTTQGPATTASADLSTTEPTPPGVLVFHKTSGFRHESIPAGIEAIAALGEELGFRIIESEDATLFTDAGLAGYDVIVFLNTTGDVLDRAQESAMESFVASGGGFVGIHSAADTEYEWEWYGGLIGAYFDSHPAPQPATVEVLATDHAAMRGIPDSFELVDEWYNFRDVPDPEVTILASLDEGSYEGGTMGEPHPIAWAHEYGGGRSFYTGFGHTAESFSESIVLTQLRNGIQWAAGRH